ncbi:hypothetical protein QL285_082984 [Trifolium repens]|nr:hypothetical protein QL285_082984 [Trifolium repens]
MLADKTRLWYRVLVARYGEEAWRVTTGGRRSYSWWREITRIRDGVGEVAERGWFEEGVDRRVGNGIETFFWLSTIADMHELRWGELHVADQWLWRYDPGRCYSVRCAYNFLKRRMTDLIWHKQVPLKVSVLAWRLLYNRLPTRDNLVRRHIIAYDAQLCVIGCGGVKTAHHLFMSCPVLASLWCLVRNWVGISTADLFLISSA